MLELADTLCALAPALCRSPAWLAAHPGDVHGLLLYLTSAGHAIAGCANLADRADLPDSDALCVAAAVQLVLQGSPPLLAAWRGAVASTVAGQAVLTHAQLAPLIDLELHCTASVRAADHVMDLLATPERHAAAAAFAASTARPEVMMAWLQAMAQTLWGLPTKLVQADFLGGERKHGRNASCGATLLVLAASPLLPQPP